MANNILRLPAVKARTGLSRTTIYNRVNNGSFPKPIKIGVRAIGWLESNIDEWVAHQVEQSQTPFQTVSES
jgi:prophage regulatory protein